MKSSILRRFVLVTQVLVLITLVATFYVVKPAATTDGFGVPLFLVWLSCSTLAIAVAWLVSLPLMQRIRRLKQMAEGLLDVPLHPNGTQEASNELGALELSLSGVAAQLRTLVDRLRLESARREAILASMAEGVLAVDSDLRIIFSNNAMFRAVGGNRRISENTRLLALIRDTGLFETLRDVVTTGERASTLENY